MKVDRATVNTRDYDWHEARLTLSSAIRKIRALAERGDISVRVDNEIRMTADACSTLLRLLAHIQDYEKRRR